MAGIGATLLSAMLLLVLGLGRPTLAAEAPVVAAAADLQFALAEVADDFQRRTGLAVKLSFGSSGNAHRQIMQGAPFELYLSADEGYVLDLHARGKTRDEGVLYAIGRIGVMVPHASLLTADGSLKDLAAALEDGRLKKFTIANPEHAPYGRAAREALVRAGLWDKLQPRLVLGENISQAGQFVASGSCQAGIIALSLVKSPKLAALGSFDLIPAQWHQPLRQRMALLKSAGPVAEAFYDYVQSPPAREVLRRFGFVLPGEE
ncbi:MAG: molybdate ABC transporter substrate-binding protein [Thermodesulfobacteriota bacterium]